MAGFKLFNFSTQLTELSMRTRGARHEILSGNIANADTPGFRPRDLDFESIMRRAAQLDDDSAGTREQKMERLLTTPLEFEESVHEQLLANPKHGEERLDGNSVGLDRQVLLLNENALSYEASLTLFSRAMAKLRFVIADGKG